MPDNQRTIIELLDREFSSLIEALRLLTRSVPEDLLYRRPPTPTVGENILKSAGIVEQAFGGITTNLWDDPFEWTLPETLSTNDQVIEYLEEVEQTRKRAFACFAQDSDLVKKIATPSGEMRPLISVLLETLLRALEFQGRALALLNTFNRSLMIAEE